LTTWRDTTETGRLGSEFEAGFYNATSTFSVAAYGGTGGGSSTATADNAAIARALAAAVAAGGGIVYIPEGDWHLTAAYDPGDNIVWQGAGMGVTILRQTVTETRVFSYNSTARDFCAFRDFTAYGMWEANQTLGGDDDRHFAVNNYTRVLYDNIESRYCRQMGFTSNGCEEVVVRNCRIRYCARDGMNLSASGQVIVTGCHIRGCNDDAIAIHTQTTSGNPPTEGHVVQGNVVEDSYGIKVFGAVKARIVGNTISRAKGYGVMVSGPLTTEGSNDALDVVIANNTISDVIDSSVFGEGVQREHIWIGNDTTSFQAPVVGAATPDVNLPDELSYLSNGSGQNAGAQGFVITGNVCAVTLPEVATYSTWGFGEAFTASGFSDPDLTGALTRANRGVRISGAILTVSITNNHFENLANGVWLDSAATHLEHLQVVGNVFRRYASAGVYLDKGSVTRGRALIVGNSFDGDPYFEHTSRVAGGKWGNVGEPCAVFAYRFDSVVIRACSFRNLAKAVQQVAGPWAQVEGCTFYAEPAVAATLASPNNADNRGMRSLDYLYGDGCLLVWENSDPTSATYGQVIDSQYGLAEPSMPSGGYYVTGQTVRSVGVTESGSAASKYTLVGWRRLTTGNAHVLNTDWRELRALTGN
jgi:hypothetical protein